MEFNFEDLEFFYEENNDFKLILNGLFDLKGKIAVCGDNACGKTTFFKILKGIITGYSGKASANGKDIKEIHEKTVYIGSNPYLQFFNSTVKDETGFFLYNTGKKKEEAEKEILRITEKFKIQHLLQRDPSSLSGGEAVLALLASFFVMRPKIILIDEIFERLDKTYKEIINNMFDEAIKDSATAVFFITHNPFDIKYANKMIVFEKGKIIHWGNTDYARKYFN